MDSTCICVLWFSCHLPAEWLNGSARRRLSLGMGGMAARRRENPPTCRIRFRGSSVNIGATQRRLAWPLRKDDTHEVRSVNKNLPTCTQSSPGALPAADNTLMPVITRAARCDFREGRPARFQASRLQTFGYDGGALNYW